jgi:hypothetical protein
MVTKTLSGTILHVLCSVFVSIFLCGTTDYFYVNLATCDFWVLLSSSSMSIWQLAIFLGLITMLIRASLKTGYKVKSSVVESEATTLNL